VTLAPVASTWHPVSAAMLVQQVSLGVKVFKAKVWNLLGEIVRDATTLMNVMMGEVEDVWKTPDVSTRKVPSIAESVIMDFMGIKQLVVTIDLDFVQMARFVMKMQSVFVLLGLTIMFAR